MNVDSRTVQSREGGGIEPSRAQEQVGERLAFAGVIATLGLISIGAGVLQLVAGKRARQYRSRGLIIASVVAGLWGLFACQCAPFSILLLVFTLVTLSDDGVREAFSAVERGETPDAVRARLG